MSRTREQSAKLPIFLTNYLFTASNRKVAGFSEVMDIPSVEIQDYKRRKGLNLRKQGPRKFQETMEEQIYNGDNEIPEGKTIPVGIMDGLPFVAHAQRGENEVTVTAETESHNKVQYGMQFFVGQEVGILATDTIGISSADPDLKLGKPPKHPEFPKGDNVTEVEIAQFKEWYLNTYFAPGNELLHIQAFSMINAATAEQVDITSIISQTVPQDVRKRNITVFDGSGAGGIPQQLIRWGQDDVRQLVQTPEMNEFLNEQTSLKRINELFILHIIGVPTWQIRKALKIFAYSEGQKNSLASNNLLQGKNTPAYAH